jgi:hypothetical protein
MIDQGHLRNGKERCRERRHHKAHIEVRVVGLKGDTTKSWNNLRKRCEDLKLHFLTSSCDLGLPFDWIH